MPANLWFAVWSKYSAYALDVYPEEIPSHRAGLESQGEHVGGPFTDFNEALKMALTRCYDLRNDGKQRKRKRRQPFVACLGRENSPPEIWELIEKVLDSR
jgi:hypothetical protein